MRHATLILLGSLLLATASAAFANTTYYRTPAEFQAATTGNVMLDFNGLPAGPVAGNAFQAEGYIFFAPGGPLNIGVPDYFSSTEYLNIGLPPNQCCSDTFDALDIWLTGNYQAFGVRFVQEYVPEPWEYIDVFDQNGNLILHQEYVNPAVYIPDPGNGFPYDSFFGVVTDVNIGHIFVYEAPNDNSDVGYDDFQLANPSGPAVPEPSAILLFGTGLLGLAGVLRRRLL